MVNMRPFKQVYHRVIDYLKEAIIKFSQVTVQAQVNKLME